MRKYKLRITRTVEDYCIVNIDAANLAEAYNEAEHKYITGKLEFKNPRCGHNIQMVNPKEEK